jgi:hypothetical protein
MQRFVEVRQNGAAKGKGYPVKKNSIIKVKGADWIKVVAEKSDVVSMEQHHNDLLIRFSDGSQVRLQDYFLCSAEERADLSIADPVAKQNLDVAFSDTSCGTGDHVLAYSLTPSSDGYVSGFLPVAAAGIGLGPILGGGAVIAGAGVAAGGGGGSGGGGTTQPDQTPPGAPTVNPTNGSVVTGTAEAGASVTLDLDGNGSTDATVTADGSGNWTYTPPTRIPDGTTVIVKAVDPAGNTSPPTNVIVDGATPTPNITNVTDDFGAVTGNVAKGGVTDDARPAISGSGAETGATIAVFDGATQIGTTQANASGGWSFTPAQPLAEGPHSFTVRATDALGNVSGQSAAYAVTIDADGVPPGTPVITAITDDVGTITGTVANGGTTDDKQPAVVGSGAPPNATVALFDGATQIGTTQADGSGNWSFTPAAPLGDGAHSFTARAVNGSSNGPASPAYTLTIDSVPPSAPTINPTDGTAITGTAEPGATVNLDLDGNGTVEVSVPADGSGNWSYTPPTAIPDGTTVTATATDPAGNISPPASTVVDNDAPLAAPIITSVTDDVGVFTGIVVKGGVTDDTLPTITGSGAPAGAVVQVFDGSILLGAVQASAVGTWIFTPTAPLGQGTHSFTARVADSQGTSPASAAYAVSIDTTPPAAPIVNPTNGTQVTGAAEAGASVILDINGDGTTDATVTANNQGVWTYTPATPIPDGTTVTARARDAAGNTSGPGTTVVDNDGPLPPAAPIITAITDDIGTLTGTVANGGFTDDTRPAVSGTGAPSGATVQIFDGATLLGTTVAAAGGAWSFTPASALGQGAHNFTAKVVTGQGTSSASGVYAVSIDTTPPATPVINPTDGDSVTGTAEPNSTVRLDIDGDGTPDVSVTTDGSGIWTYTPIIPIPDGTTVTAVAVDAAGNASGPASAIVDTDTDTTAPAAPVIGSVVDDVGTETGTIVNGGNTDDSRPTINGSGAEANATVTVFDGTTEIGTTTANGAGVWSLTPSTPLGTGSHSFTARVTDAAGNVGPLSNGYGVNIVADTTPPAAPTIGNVTDDVGAVTGPVPNGGNTDDTLPTISGTAEAKATLTVFDGATALGTAVANGTGNWTFTPATQLDAGSHSFTARATDVAGNVGPLSATYDVTIVITDTTPPGAPVIGAVTDDIGPVTGTVVNGGNTDDTIPVISGSGAEANATVTVFDGGNSLGTTTADGSGNWTFTPDTALGAGSHSFTARVTDGAGNIGPASPAYSVTVIIPDTTPPAAPVIGAVTDDVGPVTGTVANGGNTDDTIPAISGSGAEANATVTVFDGGNSLGMTTADGSGNWTFTPGTALGAGSHSFTARVTDAAGNVSSASPAYGITIVLADTTPPAAPVIGAVTDDVGAVTGTVSNGGTTDDTVPVISGSGAEANATVTVFDGGNSLGTTTADGSGSWTFTPGTPLGAGSHSFTAQVTDAAGNVGPASAAYAVTVELPDTTPPAAPVIGAVTDDVGPVTGTVSNGGTTDDTIPVISGSGAEANATVTVFDGGNSLGTTTADGSGNWTFTSGALGTGSHSFTARVTDAAGNVGPASGPYAITIAIPDITPPAAPVINSLTDDVGPVTGAVASGGTTDDVLPQIVGSGAEANATVTVFDGGNSLGTTTADGSGNWTFTPGSALGSGSHSFTARVTDTAGNIGPASAAYTVTVSLPDTTPPTATVSIVSITVDTGAADFVTEDAAVTINGTLSAELEAGERVEVQIDPGGDWQEALVEGTNWYFATPTLTAGSHGIQVRVIDDANNVGDTDGRQLVITDVNEAPIVLADSDSLLGLLGAEVLDLLDIGGQGLSAFDPDGNLESVVVRYAPLLNLGNFTLTASAQIAADLGLQFNVVDVAGALLPTLILPSSTLTITAVGGGPISNQAINELLATVHFNQDIGILGNILGAQVLGATQITATDENSLSGQSTTASLINLNLLDSDSPNNIREGTSGADVSLNGTSSGDRIYGHGGNDTINGLGGNDLLRGGAGSDSLSGGTGADVLIYDAADSLIDGGANFDTLLIDAGSLTLNAAVTNIVNIERIHLGYQDGAHNLTLTAGGIANASVNDRLVVTGDGDDTVTLTNATFDGQTMFNGNVYNQYSLGTSTALLETALTVIA